MKVGIMQPYIFPYIGYFQLLKAVDVFVLYDDVNFIKQGWVNRNRILVNGAPFLFTVPVEQISSFVTIKETALHQKKIINWREKFYKTLHQNYRKAPFFEQTYAIVKKVFDNEHLSIASLCESSIRETAQYLGIKTKLKISSGDFATTKGLEKADRLIAICKQLGTDEYINPSGGKELYTKEYFAEHGVNLKFIETNPAFQYLQFNNQFVPWLSMIDVLMFNDKTEIINLLNQHELC